MPKSKVRKKKSKMTDSNPKMQSLACPFCPMVFEGLRSDKEVRRARFEHVLIEHGPKKEEDDGEVAE